MALRPITSRDESAKAFATFKERFAQGAQVFPGHKVGYQGGGQQCDVFWHVELGIWGLFEPRVEKGRYWICFGLENPANKPMLTITVETNPPIEGVNRRCAGAFLRDSQGNVYIAHSGNVGGGRKGIGKTAFREYGQSGSWKDVFWPDNNRVALRVICRLDALDLPIRIADFVNEVARFKKSIVSGEQKRTNQGIPPPKNISDKGKPTTRFGKYKPLFTHLSNLKDNEWHATFREIEHVLGFALPKSAYSYPAWWSNGSRMPHSSTWLIIGWRTSDLNLTGKTVWFRREKARLASRETGSRGPKTRSIPMHAGQTKPDNNSVPDYQDDGLGPVESLTQIALRFNWASVGELAFDLRSKLVFPDVPMRPGVYRFTLINNGETSVYFGETENLRRRFNHYRNPGPSQATNIRINKLFSEALCEHHDIRIAVIVDTAWICNGGVERLADLSIKAERVLLENAAIVQAQSQGGRLLNR